MRSKIYLIYFIIGLFLFSCSKKDDTSKGTNDNDTSGSDSTQVSTEVISPPSTWQEHWSEHVQKLHLTYYDTAMNVWYDDDMSETNTSWAYKFAGSVWNYIKKTYGTTFGPDTTNRLNVVLHANKYGGGHPGYYYAADHDYRNCIDIGEESATAWQDKSQWEYEILIHEQGHIVESCTHNHFGSICISLWHDSKWMEIFMYDILYNLGYSSQAETLFNRMQTTYDDFPQANTQWFKSWFYPIWSQYGKSTVLSKFWTLCSKYYKQEIATTGKYIGSNYYNYVSQGKTLHGYSAYMNFGEFVHFWSGAANTDLSDLALNAFGRYDEDGNDWTVQLSDAKVDYPDIVY